MVLVVNSLDNLDPCIWELSTVIRKVNKKTAEIVEGDSSIRYHVPQCEDNFDALSE